MAPPSALLHHDRRYVQRQQAPRWVWSITRSARSTRARVLEIAKEVLALNPVTVYNAKVMYKFTRNMEWNSHRSSPEPERQNADDGNKEKGRVRASSSSSMRSRSRCLGAYRREDS